MLTTGRHPYIVPMAEMLCAQKSQMAVPGPEPPAAVFCSVHSDLLILCHFQTLKNQEMSYLKNYF